MRKTKIVCTIGPKTCTKTSLERLVKHGMNIARLNMSHGDQLWHKKVISLIKSINRSGKHSISIILDTKGPEIRSGDIKKELKLKKGDIFTFTIKKSAEYPEYYTEVNYDKFIDDISVGDKILVDGGLINFQVIRITVTDIICECLDGGIMGSRRHLNIMGKSTNLPSITKKDWEDIDFGIKEGIDFIALSFVKNSSIVKKLKKYLKDNNSPIDIISKIESADSIPHIDNIIKESDGIMVARGDLGAETPIEEIPLLQEEIVKKCIKNNKPVIVATHFLESMILHPTPTRAEVTDISEAVKEYSDAIMLSGETAAGNYPIKALKVMDKVAKRIELRLKKEKKIDIEISNDSKKEIARSSVMMANHLKAGAIIVITRRGNMAKIISKFRPNCDIYAFTNTTTIRRKLNLYWGVLPLLVKLSKDPEKTIQRALEIMRKRKLEQINYKVIIVSDILAGEKMVETIQIRSI